MKIMACCMTALVLACGISATDSFADHGTPCRISLSSTIYDSEWREVDRKSADGRYYPGDGANFLVKWVRDDTCRGFKILQPESYANAVIGPVFEIRGTNHTIPDLPDSLKRSSQAHFELEVIDVSDVGDPPEYEFSWERSGTPKVWTEWVEDDASKERFRAAVENRCNTIPSDGRQQGCIYGHVELDMAYRGELCFEERRRGDVVEKCRASAPKILFSAEGQGKRCTHGKMPTCTTFTVERSTGKTLSVRQPTLDLILERSPFRDVYGFDVINQDGSFYVDDLMGVGHSPNMTYTKGGVVQFVVEVRGDPRYHDSPPWSDPTRKFDKEWPGIEPERSLSPAVILQCIYDKSCVVSDNHPRTDDGNYTLTHGHGKRGYHTLDVGNYTFFYSMSAYNIGSLSERTNEGRGANWLDDRLLNSSKGYIEIHAGPYDPVVSLYGHSIWNASGINTPDAQTGITVTYNGSMEGDDVFPERRMRIDATHSMAVAYNSTYAIISNGTAIEPYEPVLVRPGERWAVFDSHGGNHTTIGNRTMMESAGYGTIRLHMDDLSDVMMTNGLGTGIVNATGHFTPYTRLLGGQAFTWLNSTSYTYPEGYHAIPLNITVYGSDGNVKPARIDVFMAQSNGTDRTFREYVAAKVGEEQNNTRVTEIVSSYANLNHTASSDTGQLISYVPRLAHVYFTDRYQYDFASNHTDQYGNGTGTIPNHVEFYSPDVQEGLVEQTLGDVVGDLLGVLPDTIGAVELLPGGEQIGSLWGVVGKAAVDPRADEALPLYLGLQGADSPTNMTISVDGVINSWDILDTSYSQPITIVVNTEQDNEAWFDRTDGATIMAVLPTFGTVTALDDGNVEIPALCSERCVVGNIDSGITITAHNVWNGTATATYETAPVPAVEYVPIPHDDILPWNEITLVALVIAAIVLVCWRLQGGSWPLLGD